MHLHEYCAMMHQEDVPDIVVLAAAILEARGKQFAVDFGFGNAVEKAEEILRQELACKK